MKNIAIALLTMIVATPAFAARAPKSVVSAELTQFNLQPETYLSRQVITDAQVVVTKTGEPSLYLRIDFKSNCPANAMCIAMMPLPLEVTVPLQSIETGGCHETIYKGVIDQRPVDGLRQELTVVDNRTNTCKYFAPIPATEVHFSREAYRPQISEHHVLGGSALR